MAKPVGARCNLACEYCYYLEKASLLGQSGRAAMSDEVLEAYVRQVCEATTAPSVDFAWQGGEPTLAGLDFYRRVLEVQHRHAGGRVVRNSLQTNGTLINDEWAAFFAENQFLIGLSLDGPEPVHNTYRRNKAGAGAFEGAMRGLRALQKHGVQVNGLAVVGTHNCKLPLETYNFLIDQGLRYIQFIPLVERQRPNGQLAGPPALGQEDAEVTPWSVPPERYGEFLVTVFDEWVRRDVGRISVQLFDVAMYAWMGLPAPLCWFTQRCGSALALEHDGSVFACDHFVYPEYRLGNLLEKDLSEMARSAAQRAFGDARADLPATCAKCSVRFACHGECPKRRFARAPNGEPGLNYLCPAYKRFFRHIDPTMRRMAKHLRAGRPAAEIMHETAGHGLR